MRRSARRLVALQPQAFGSAYGREESARRLAELVATTPSGDALRGTVGPERVRLTFARRAKGGSTVYEGEWTDAQGAIRLDGHYSPAASTLRLLRAASILMAMLFIAILGAFVAEGTLVLRASLIIVFVLATFAFPFVALGLASQREVEEIAIAKAVRRALGPEE